MTTITISIDLPNDRIRDAEEFGVLDAGVIASLIESELDRRIMAMVNAEIHLFRGEKAAAQQHDDDQAGSL